MYDPYMGCAINLTPQQLRALADLKENEIGYEDEEDKPVKTGILKCDLYYINTGDLIDYIDDFMDDNKLAIKEDLDKIQNIMVEKIAELVLPKGWKFTAYKDGDSLLWYDDDKGFIEDIKDI